jgi:hypothetical protein
MFPIFHLVYQTFLTTVLLLLFQNLFTKPTHKSQKHFNHNPSLVLVSISLPAAICYKQTVNIYSSHCFLPAYISFEFLYLNKIFIHSVNAQMLISVLYILTTKSIVQHLKGKPVYF